jgi:hypothetical protein
VLRFIGERFSDHGRRLEDALHESADRAWRCLEVALAGSSWWQSCKHLLTPREDKSLARHVQEFLDKVPSAELPGDPAKFRKDCLAELRSARNVGLVPGDRLGLGELAEEVRTFAGYSDPRRRLAEERRQLDGMAGVLRGQGFALLATYVTLRPGGGEPLLAQACRYFFRRAVENDEKLAAGLTMDTLEHVSTAQEAGFDGLREALDGHGLRLEGLLAGVHAAVMEARDAATGTRDEVREMRSQLEQQDHQLRQMAAMLSKLLEQRQEPPAAVTPARAAAPAAAERPFSPPPASARDEEAKPRAAAKRPAAEPPPSPASPVAVSPLPPAPASTPSPASDGWDDVRRLLAKCQTLSPRQQNAEPELAKAIDEFTATARSYEETRRTYLHLQQHQVGDNLPVYPEGQPAEVPVARPVTNSRLISAIFLPAAEPVDDEPPMAEEAPPAPPPAKKRRLLSSLFDPPDEAKE